MKKDVNVMEVKEGLIYLHFKGGCYLVEGVVTNTETNEKMVLYRSLDGNDDLCYWHKK